MCGHLAADMGGMWGMRSGSFDTTGSTDEAVERCGERDRGLPGSVPSGYGNGAVALAGSWGRSGLLELLQKAETKDGTFMSPATAPLAGTGLFGKCRRGVFVRMSGRGETSQGATSPAVEDHAEKTVAEGGSACGRALPAPASVPFGKRRIRRLERIRSAVCNRNLGKTLLKNAPNQLRRIFEDRNVVSGKSS